MGVERLVLPDDTPYGADMHISSILANLHMVVPGIARSAQPFTFRQWERIMDRHGFRTVINLRGDNPKAQWYRDELAICAQRHVLHHDILLSSKRLPSRQTLLQLMEAIEKAPKPVLFKCAGGAERTGLTAAMLVLAQGGGIIAARRQLRAFPYLHIPKKQQRWIREFLRFYEATHNDQPLRCWLQDVYTDEALAQFMIAQGKGDYWRRDWH